MKDLLLKWKIAVSRLLSIVQKRKKSNTDRLWVDGIKANEVKRQPKFSADYKIAQTSGFWPW